MNVKPEDKINSGRVSYLDSGNYSTSRTVRQPSHLLHCLHLLLLPSAPTVTKTHRRESPKQTAEARRLTVRACGCRGTHTCGTVEEGERQTTTERRWESIVGANHWGDAMQGEQWWEPLGFSRNPYSPSLFICAAHSLCCFTASRFRKKKKKKQPMGCFWSLLSCLRYFQDSVYLKSAINPKKPSVVRQTIHISWKSCCGWWVWAEGFSSSSQNHRGSEEASGIVWQSDKDVSNLHFMNSYLWTVIY